MLCYTLSTLHRNGREIGIYYHYFWQCKSIKRFCGTISQGLLQIRVKRHSGLFILPSKDVNLTHLNFKLRGKLLLLARKCTLMRWTKDTPSNATLCCRETFRVPPHEGTRGPLLKCGLPCLTRGIASFASLQWPHPFRINSKCLSLLS